MNRGINLFDVAYMAVFPAAAGAVVYKMWRHGKYRESAPALIGRQLREDTDSALFENGCVWIHAVSVGEVMAAKAMLPLLRKHFQNTPILITTHTETGQSAARNLPPEFVDAVRYFPVDFSWLMRRAVATWKPRVFIVMETELWPNALQIIRKSDTPVFTLNGKISERSFRSYQRLGKLIRRPLSCVTAFCTQTDGDATRIGALLGKTGNIHVTGNCKFDIPIPMLDENEKAVQANELNLPWPVRYIVAGSTHPGEEEIILRAFDYAAAQDSSLQLILVPRHPERFDEAWELLKKRGIPAQRVSDKSTTGEGAPRVHLVDKMGVLTRLYGLAEIAVVAGSFVPGIGGHNLLEPAAHAVPVIYGPYMKSQPDMVRIMNDSGAGTQVDATDLGAALTKLLNDASMARQKGEAGRVAFLANQGSAQRNMDVIQRYLKQGDMK